MLSKNAITSIAFVVLAFINCAPALARDLKSNVSEIAQIPTLRADYPVPKEPNMLFYIQRSVNSNTVIYAARIDAQGRLDKSQPVEAYWRWYNVDGHRKALNFLERHMAYGVSADRRAKTVANRVAFKVVALPEKELFLERDSQGAPHALIQMGDHLARLVYAYLQVDDSGWMPDVKAIDLFGIDTTTGKSLHEHVVRD